MKRIISLVMALIILGTVSFGMTGKEVMQKSKDRDTGTIEMWGSTYDKEKDLSKSIMVFKAPAAVKNTRFLQIENDGRDNDKWIYLPALGRVRRISSSEGSSSFMGSDFTYDDMETRELEEDTHKLLREEKLGKYDCYVIESISKDIDDSQYSKRISWVSKDSFIPVKGELYSKKTGKVQKVMIIKQNIKKVQDIWTVFETVMEDKESGHKTKLYVKRSKKGAPYIEYNKKINASRFTQRYLKTGR